MEEVAIIPIIKVANVGIPYSNNWVAQQMVDQRQLHWQWPQPPNKPQPQLLPNRVEGCQPQFSSQF
jgi:hypothetical protein